MKKSKSKKISLFILLFEYDEKYKLKKCRAAQIKKKKQPNFIGGPNKKYDYLKYFI